MGKRAYTRHASQSQEGREHIPDALWTTPAALRGATRRPPKPREGVQRGSRGDLSIKFRRP
eukprot:4068497-Pyramimonas_sp.AAC.1